MPSEKREEQLKVIRAINAARHAVFKIVCTESQDVEEWRKNFEAHVPIPPEKIMLMPEGTTQEELALRRQDLAACAAKYGYGITQRLQCR